MATLNERLSELEAFKEPAIEDSADTIELYTLIATVMVAKLERSREQQARILREQGFKDEVAQRLAGMSFNAARDELAAFQPDHNCTHAEMADALKRLRAAVLKGYAW
jgi:hypothetical protein